MDINPVRYNQDIHAESKGVYCIRVNKKNFYVGATTVNFHTRLRTHIYELNKNNHHAVGLQHAYNKHKHADVFILNIMDEQSDDSIFFQEKQAWIKINSMEGSEALHACPLGKRYGLPEDTKSITIIDPCTGKEVCEYEDAHEAALFNNGNDQTIRCACNSNITHAYNYIWLFTDSPTYEHDKRSKLKRYYKQHLYQEPIYKVDIKTGKVIKVYNTRSELELESPSTAGQIVSMCRQDYSRKVIRKHFWCYWFNYSSQWVRERQLDTANSRSKYITRDINGTLLFSL